MDAITINKADFILENDQEGSDTAMVQWCGLMELNTKDTEALAGRQDSANSSTWMAKYSTGNEQNTE